MRYAQIRRTDISNGIGIRTALFVQGCTRHCKGCFNQETWDFDGGMEWTVDVEDEFIDLTAKEHIHGATILGGEPFDVPNRKTVKHILQRLRMEVPGKNTWMYSSYLFEDILKEDPEILKYIDVLVDGAFIEEEKDMKLRFRGSRNQRVIDVPKSLEEEKVVLKLS
ncbi:MAG: anaerobic ribonucleoside-triphosphate reductase activating protein [Anaerostipes sp.]